VSARARPLRQRLAALTVRLAQRFGPRTVRVLGAAYQVGPDVFNPRFFLTSKFMARHVRVGPQDAVLDVGTGSGILAVTAARTARRVVAVDVNPQAVQCARENVRRNGLEGRVEVLHGDLFSPVPPEQRFDVILFTPPYFEGPLRRPFDHALYDPGKALARRFLAGAAERLKLGGHVQMLYSSLAAPKQVLRMAEELGWRWSVVARKRALFETFTIYRLDPAVAGAVRRTGT
jgi:HemK-related putative methylase